MIKKLTLSVLFLFTASACSTSKNPAPAAPRVPASTIQDFEMAKDKETSRTLRDLDAALLTGKKSIAQDAINKRLGQVLTHTSAGYKLMKIFDEQLAAVADNSDFDLATNTTYLKMLKLRSLLTAVEDRMASAYVHMWQVGLGLDPYLEKLSPARREKMQLGAFELIEYTHSRLGEFAGDARILGITHLRDSLSDVTDSLEGQVSTTGTSKAQVAAQQAYRSMLNVIQIIDNQASAVATMNPQDFTNVVSSEDANINAKMKEVDKERTPQAAFINKNGRDFEKNRWVLTFDDGPNKTHTRAISNVLTANGLRGEYFWLSNLVKGNGALAKEMYDKGHHINSHSKDHADLTKKSGAGLTDEVSGSRDVITKTLRDQGASDYKMVHFRCPYGACVAPKSAKVQDAIAAAGLIHVYWTVDTLDWQDKNVNSVYARALKQMKASGRGIILFHDIHAMAEQVVPLLLKDKYVTDNNVKWTQL